MLEGYNAIKELTRDLVVRRDALKEKMTIETRPIELHYYSEGLEALDAALVILERYIVPKGDSIGF